MTKDQQVIDKKEQLIKLNELQQEVTELAKNMNGCSEQEVANVFLLSKLAEIMVRLDRLEAIASIPLI